MAITSEITKKAGLKNEPVAIVWNNTKPEHALEIRPGTWALYHVVLCQGCPRWKDNRIIPKFIRVLRGGHGYWIRAPV